MDENQIQWILDRPLDTACFRTNDYKEIKIPPAVWNIKKSVMPGDKIVLIYDDNEIVFTEPIRGSTLKSILKSLERGLNRKLKNNNLHTIKNVYKLIGLFFKKDKRLELAKKFEMNDLCIKDLLGDHTFYEGHLRRNGGVWIYGVGS